LSTASGKSIPNCHSTSVGVLGLLATNRRSSQWDSVAILRSNRGLVLGSIAICAVVAPKSPVVEILPALSCSIATSILDLPILRLLTHRLEYPRTNLKMKNSEIIHVEFQCSGLNLTCYIQYFCSILYHRVAIRRSEEID
jgi:hypothetical protein